MTQEKLGELSHIHPKYISEIERGKKSPTLNIIFQLADALNITANSLISYGSHTMEQNYEYYINTKKK